MKESVVDGRIKKALESRTDSVTMLESLDAISDFFGKQGNTVETRRALRQDLEYQNIQLAKKFLIEFGDVRTQMTVVESDVCRVESECARMANIVSSADENMKLFMQRAGQLEGNRNYFAQQSEDISNFLSRFQLTQEEIDKIHTLSLEESSIELFFTAFKRLRQAYEDCKEMVETFQYSAGFELLDLLGNHQDCGYQRLFEWVKGLGENSSTPPSDASDVHLQTAVTYLREVPAYYMQCQDLVVSSRRGLIVRNFVLAMGQDLENRTTRNVSRSADVHVSDAVRHISNMLAWVHQAVASEEEFLCAVFFGSNRSSVATKNGGDVVSDFPVHDKSPSPGAKDLLVRCLHGLGRPLKARILQILGNVGRDIEVLYSIGDLLMFYASTLTKMVPVSNSVQTAVHECLAACRIQFDDALRILAENLNNSSISTFAVDTAATSFSLDCAHNLQNVLHVYKSAMSIQSASATESGCFEIGAVLSAVIHPLLQACRTCGSNTFSEKYDMAIFMVNNVSALKVYI
jgi:conserved oligomeric Golgi complex subunit 6